MEEMILEGLVKGLGSKQMILEELVKGFRTKICLEEVYTTGA